MSGPGMGDGPRRDEGIDPGDLTGAKSSFLDRPALQTEEIAANLRNLANLLPDQERAANPPQKITIDLQDYYRRVHNIALYVLNTVNSHSTPARGMPDRTGESLDPCYNQIVGNGALALAMYNGMPTTLWTPLGKLHIGGIGNRTSSAEAEAEGMEEIKEKLGLEVIVPEGVYGVKWGSIYSMSKHGAVYRITKDLEGNELPEVITLNKVSYIDYGDAKKIWKDVKPEGRRG